MTEDEMVGWHHQFKGHEFEQAPGVERRGSLACCSPWGHKESDMPEQLKNKNKCSTGANKWFGRALCMPCMPYRCMTYVGKKKKNHQCICYAKYKFSGSLTSCPSNQIGAS